MKQSPSKKPNIFLQQDYRDFDSGSNEVLEKYEHTYDKNNHIKSEYLYNNYASTTKHKNSSKKIVDELREYDYDKLGRLTETNITDKVANDTNNITYKYDKVGNRIKEVNKGKTTNYTYNSLNQLVSSVEVGDADSDSGSEEGSSDDKGESHTTLSDKKYTYDLNGNQLREADSVTKEVKCYTYDADNRMANAMFTKDGVVSLNQVNTYNGKGQRVEKAENGQSTKYYYQNDAVLYTTGKADKSTKLEQPDNTEIMTGVTSLNLMGTSENAIATVRNISSSEGERYYFYNKDMRESTTNVIDVEGKSNVSYEKPRSKGGSNSYSNAQVLSRKLNREKLNK